MEKLFIGRIIASEDYPTAEVIELSLTGKTALIAGASRGIGLAIAQQIASEGAHTILASRSLANLEKHARELREKGLSAEARALDIADPKAIVAFAETLPDIDILINVAGTNVRKHIGDYTAEEYDRI